jgi:uncharacterized RDD family membrane protein YckC
MPASLLRRLGAMVYDALLLAAILMIGTALFLPLTHGEAVGSATHPVLHVIHQATMLALIVGFYGLFWTRGGQTLGMASWHLKVQREDGGKLTWKDALLRLAAALLSWLPAGLGFVWIAFDREGRAWHDRLSHTRVVALPKTLPRG